MRRSNPYPILFAERDMSKGFRLFSISVESAAPLKETIFQNMYKPFVQKRLVFRESGLVRTLEIFK